MPFHGSISALAVGEVGRILGRIRGTQPGPTLLAIAGIHGNEPAGVLALQRVLQALEGRRTQLFGEFTALSGNRAALAKGRRYLARDLNRAWTPILLAKAGGEAPEDREQTELLSAVDGAIADARGPVFLLDLHTTSGPGKPFSTIMDSLSSRRFALRIPVPLIVGIGELVDGTLLGYLADRGIPGVVFEGGQHSDSESVATSEAAIWLALAGAGVIRESGFSEVGKAGKLLLAATEGLPRVLELKHRHPVESGDGFRMLPGFRTFQPVEAGDVLAEDRRGPVKTPERGRLLMPLYQAQGEDGFFLVREFHPLWLTLSEILRRLRLGRILHWLPGVRRDPMGPHRLRVNKQRARWFPLEILHLLGFRKTLEDGDWLVVIRQKEASPPA